MTVAAFGEILWDIYPDTRVLGGAPLNFAAHCAQHGAHVYMLSAVGEDALGAQALDQLRRWGVYTEQIHRHPQKPTGQCIVTLDKHGTPSYRLSENVAWDAIPVKVSPSPVCDTLYCGTLALRSESNRQALRALFQTEHYDDVFVDVNLRPPFYDEESLSLVLSHATILKISEEELSLVLKTMGIHTAGTLDTVCRRIAAFHQNIRLILITCGGNGACAYDTIRDVIYETAAVRTTVVSTVGAGDSFCAAFLCAYKQHGDVKHALAHAVAVAAFVVSHLEAVPLYHAQNLFEKQEEI